MDKTMHLSTLKGRFPMSRFLCALFGLLCVYLALVNNAYSETRQPDNQQTINILNLTDFEPTTWEEIRFNGLSDYKIVEELEGAYLRAESQSSASGLLLKKTVDLTKTPYLNWTWRLEKGLSNLAEMTKSGDDYAARIYLIHEGGWFFWQTKALNYVWSSRNLADSRQQTWENAYAPNNALMKAVRDKSDGADIWFKQKRNVKEDFKLWLEDDITHIQGIAIMTDTDDSKGHAIVHYGDIYFSAD